MKHTPGPWTLELTRRGDPFARAYIKHSSGFVCAIYGGRAEEVCGADEADANARLIAVAPELLKALRAMIDMATDNRAHGPEIDRACAAIAKAEGGTP